MMWILIAFGLALKPYHCSCGIRREDVGGFSLENSYGYVMRVIYFHNAGIHEIPGIGG